MIGIDKLYSEGETKNVWIRSRLNRKKNVQHTVLIFCTGIFIGKKSSSFLAEKIPERIFRIIFIYFSTAAWSAGDQTFIPQKDLNYARMDSFMKG